MTLITYQVGARASTRFSATCNGAPLPLWGHTVSTQFNTIHWSVDTPIQQSWATIATDETVTISVSLIGGSIQSAVVFTNAVGVTRLPVTISGGVATFNLPPDTCCWLQVNEDRPRPLLLASRPIVPTPSGPGVITYDGTQTKAATGTTLVFPAGEHVIGQSFVVEPGASIFAHGGAWLIGSLLFQGQAGNSKFYGHGGLSGESVDKGPIRSLPFQQQVTYSLIRGEFGVFADNYCDGVFLVDTPWYSTYYGVNVFNRVTVIAPWWGNANGFFPSTKFPGGGARISKCLCFVHDDVVDFSEYLLDHRANDNLLGSIGSAEFIVAYWPDINRNLANVATFNTIVSMNYAYENGGGNVLAWCDGGSDAGGELDGTEEHHVVSDIYFDGLRFEGTQIRGRPFDFRNRPYPLVWSPPAPGLANGQIRNVYIRNVSFSVVPQAKSIIAGKDRINTPHDFFFENVFYAGVRLTVANFDEYFERNEFPYNIYVDGIPLLPNTTSTGSWYVTDPELAPFSYQPLPARLNDGRVYDGPQVWLPTGAVLPTRGPFRNVTTPANWSASDVLLSAQSLGLSTGNAFPRTRVAFSVSSAGVSATQAGLRVRQALSVLSQGGAIGQAGLVRINPNQLAGTSSGVSSASAGLAAAVAMRGASNETSAARADLFAPGTEILSGQSTGTSTGTARLSVILQESSSQGEIMKQRIYNALLAVCQAGPFYKADVNVKTGQMSVFISQKEQPLAVDIVEVSKEFREASNYRRAYNIGEIASWVFAVTVRFRSGVRVSCETFEEQVADTGIKVPEARGVVSSRPLLARLTDSRYDEAPAQNPNLGTVVVFTFEVVPETLRK